MARDSTPDPQTDRGERDDAQIRVSRLTKIYKSYWGPRALLRELLFSTPGHHPIVALDDVSLDVAAGESFGVVGDNGAGKSTLLKILAGTAFPTSGSVEVHGEVSALLELGSGFHPEFSGRDNILFSGALMGLSREEIKDREESIIAFSDLADFIDQPVKTYSTGMYVRLGFAVATGFDPEILIIDEALAVGDQNFQKKCTDRIVDFKKAGGTIFFCSHSLHQVRTLCDRAVWLNRGKIERLGNASDVVEKYNSFCRAGTAESVSEPAPASRKSEFCWIESVKLLGARGPEANVFNTGESMTLEIEAHFSESVQEEPAVGVAVVRNDGETVYMTSTADENVRLGRFGTGKYRIKLVFPEIPLLSGKYHFNVVTTDRHNLHAYDILERVQPFTVLHEGGEAGVARISHHWES